MQPSRGKEICNTVVNKAKYESKVGDKEFSYKTPLKRATQEVVWREPWSFISFFVLQDQHDLPFHITTFLQFPSFPWPSLQKHKYFKIDASKGLFG